jgi:hypothetical protein
MTKQQIDQYFTNNEKEIRSVINKSKSKFDKDVIFSNCYMNCINHIDKIGDDNHILVFIKRYVYQLYYWFKSKPIDLSEELILNAHNTSTVVSSMFSLDEHFDLNNDEEENNKESDDRLVDSNNIYNIEEVVQSLTDAFKNTLNSYDKILFENWLDNDITSRKGLLKFYNLNYKYGTKQQDDLFKIIDQYKNYIKENYVQN